MWQDQVSTEAAGLSTVVAWASELNAPGTARKGTVTGKGHGRRALCGLEALVPLRCPYPGGSSLSRRILPGVELAVDFVGFSLCAPEFTPVVKDMNIKHTWEGS